MGRGGHDAVYAAANRKREVKMTIAMSYTVNDLVLCESPDGWSLHAPNSAEEEIACGDAPYLACGEGSPTETDYEAAFAVWLTEHAE